MSSARSGAAARAAALSARARALGAAQADVHARTMGEIDALAKAAVRFFDALPMAEFSGTLLPASARGARRIRHKVVHQAMLADESGATLRALLLGRDAHLRMFSARSSVARDFLSATEPGAAPLWAGISRDVADWSPRMRLPEFRAADVLDRLSTALDTVEARLAAAERRVAAQRQALATGDLGAIRDSLGASPASTPRPALGAGPAIPDPHRRLTPGPGGRVIRPTAAATALAAGSTAPALPPGRPAAAAEVAADASVTDSAPMVGSPSEVAVSDVMTSRRQTAPAVPAAEVGTVSTPLVTSSAPGADTGAPASAADGSAEAISRAERADAPAPVPTTAAVQGAAKSGASWLSRAIRAAARTPVRTPLASDVSGATGKAPAAADGTPRPSGPAPTP